ncbi:hypothetical protein V497_07552 [Pseudogymnoascus sp. VKM F-4516 (FW-969)]|nr:hypothetical protein V497_07552 [Pseudogymnoascus sp. VKM F-4516 (FW-969)]
MVRLDFIPIWSIGNAVTQDNLDVIRGLDPAAPGEMHEAGLTLEDAGEFGHLFFEFGIGLQFDLDDFGDWLGHGGETVGVVCVAMGAFVRGSEMLGLAGDVGLAVDVGLSGEVAAAEVAGE